jgi:hypothetical protein
MDMEALDKATPTTAAALEGIPTRMVRHWITKRGTKKSPANNQPFELGSG